MLTSQLTHHLSVVYRYLFCWCTQPPPTGRIFRWHSSPSRRDSMGSAGGFGASATARTTFFGTSTRLHSQSAVAGGATPTSARRSHPNVDAAGHHGADGGGGGVSIMMTASNQQLNSLLHPYRKSSGMSNGVGSGCSRRPSDNYVFNGGSSSAANRSPAAAAPGSRVTCV